MISQFPQYIQKSKLDNYSFVLTLLYFPRKKIGQFVGENLCWETLFPHISSDILSPGLFKPKKREISLECEEFYYEIDYGSQIFDKVSFENYELTNYAFDTN